MDRWTDALCASARLRRAGRKSLPPPRGPRPWGWTLSAAPMDREVRPLASHEKQGQQRLTKMQKNAREVLRPKQNKESSLPSRPPLPRFRLAILKAQTMGTSTNANTNTHRATETQMCTGHTEMFCRQVARKTQRDSERDCRLVSTKHKTRGLVLHETKHQKGPRGKFRLPEKQK